MSTELQNQLQYEELIDALLRKTREGKLRWQETAEEDTFVAPVKGVQTFLISATFGGIHMLRDELVQDVVVTLSVRDRDSNKIFDHRETGPDSLAYELWQAARRVAKRLDERIGESLELLNSL